MNISIKGPTHEHTHVPRWIVGKMSFLFFVFRRLALLLPTLFGVSVIGFLLAYLLPGNPALVKAGPMATPQYVVEMKHKMGLDQPVYVQYARYATGLLHGDLGES